jgi:hypothetical protein
MEELGRMICLSREFAMLLLSMRLAIANMSAFYLAFDNVVWFMQGAR